MMKLSTKVVIWTFIITVILINLVTWNREIDRAMILLFSAIFAILIGTKVDRYEE